MERTFTLEPPEQRALAGLEQEQTQTLAQVGALMLDLDAAKQRLTLVQERQRSFVRSVVSARNIENFADARVLNGQVIVRLPDEPMLPAPPAGEPGAKANGQSKAHGLKAVTE